MSIRPELLRADYIRRINRVFQFIEEHLDADLSLGKMAEMAHFSPFHFHRIFKTITGETLNAYVNRKRLECAALLLLNCPELTMGDVAVQSGFNSQSSFSRAFSKYYDQSPSAFQETHAGQQSKIGQTQSKIGQSTPSWEKYIWSIDNLLKWIDMTSNIEIKDMPEMQLAYITCHGPQNLSNAYEQLGKWALPNGVVDSPEGKFLTVYHDSFRVTEPEKVRMSASVIMDRPAEPTGEISLNTMPAGRCITARFEIGVDEFEKAWSGLFLWMNENGYTMADRNPFEIYYNDYKEHPEQKFVLDLCIPVN